MKKENYYKFLYVVSAFLILGFCIRLGVDGFRYETSGNSASFYFCIIERAVEFVLPSIIIFIVARILKKKYKFDKS